MTRKRKVVDQHNTFDKDVFSYRVSKDGKVFISWQGKVVMTLKDKPAELLAAKLTKLEPRAAQLAMAKLTGNFKRGNE